MFDEIHLIREWIGMVPMEAPLYPLWGHIVKWLSHFGGDVLAQASIVSAVFFVANAVLIFFAVRGLFSVPVKIAERLAVFEEMKYDGLEYPAASIITLVYLMTPGFFAASSQPSPLTFAHFFPALMFFGLAQLVGSKHLRTFVTWTLIIGSAAAFSFLNGAIGWLPLPLVMMLLLTPFVRKGLSVVSALGLFLVGFAITLAVLAYCSFADPLNDLIRVIALTVHSLPMGFFYPGALVFFFLGLLPLIIGAIFVSTGRIRPKLLRLTFFLGWAGVGSAIAVVTLVLTILGEMLPNLRFVEGILENLDGRDVIISDGTFDDLLAFRLPKEVSVVTMGHDKSVPQELLDTVWNEDARFAADLGATAFVEDWLKQDESAAGRIVVVSPRAPQLSLKGELVPVGWCWRGERASKRLDGEKLRTDWMNRWLSISSQVQDRNAQCWYMRRFFAVQGLRIVEILKSEGRDKAAENLLSYVVGHVDSAFSREAERRRKIDRERVIACVEKLGELDTLTADDRSSRLVELEERILPELERTIGEEASWLIHVYRGEIALKKGVEFRREARDEYRAATHDERSDLNATAGKLLLLDAALRDESGTEKDALAILRRDRANRMALAIWGNTLATRGENVKAEAYLRRATAEGGPVMIEPLNDLAEVLSRLGKLGEALEVSDQVMEHAEEPNWTFIETRAAIMMRLGRLDEAGELLQRAVMAARGAKQEDVARNILDIDRARLMKLSGSTGSEYRNFVRNIKSRALTPAHRKLVDEL